jgi:uncharacterized protein (DUF58 family)
MLGKEILLKAKKSVWTNKSSDNLSKIRGDGLDFCEIRPYQFGDDIRHINFSASAKGIELQTNVYNEDKQISVIIAVVLTSSLHFGSQILKSETLAEVVAILGFSSLKQHNQTKVVLFAENEKIFSLKNEAELLNIINYILDFNYKNIKLNHKKITDFLSHYPKSLAFLISDFYENYNCKMFANKHQINTIVVRDKLEENPEFLSDLDLVNLTNDKITSVDFSSKITKKYQQKIHKIDENINNYFAKNKIKTGKIYTCDDAFLKLNNILNYG